MATNRSLSFLSWNLAMLERSAQAPPYWDASATEAAVRDHVLEIAPDLLAYQELPGLVPFVETHEMMRANPRSHSGNLATLVTTELMATEPTVSVVERCAVLTTFSDPELTIANVHLAAGRAAAPDRLMQIAKIIGASPTKSLLILGDTNMRMAEVEPLLELGFIGTKPPHVTWDSRRNRFRSEMPEFSAYFTRWFASPGVTVSDVVVHRDPVEHNSYSFFLSDHYAMSGTITTSNTS